MKRKRFSLDGEWSFFRDSERQLDAVSLDRAEPLNVRVPAPWQMHDRLRYYDGLAWYRRSFVLPDWDLEADEECYLHFGAVDYFAQVWLNGMFVGEHEGGYLPFAFPAGAFLKFHDTNELVVRVIDPPNDEDFAPEFSFSDIPHGKQSWYGTISGIWQSVYLEKCSRVHINSLPITPDVPDSQAHVLVQLSEPARGDCEVRLQLRDREGHIMEASAGWAPGQLEQIIRVPIANPILWDTQDPHLYQAHARLLRKGEEIDSFTDHFGMRTIATSADGHLRLNGRVLFLRGALDQCYYPGTIYSAFGEAELAAQFEQAKHMGLNCLRAHIKINEPRYYDGTDRAGLLVWAELPNWENLTEAAKRRARDTLTGMVRRDWNHPSIVIWTIINEGWGLELALNSEHRAWLADMYAYLKQLDPTRLAVGNSPCFTNFHVVTDIEDFHNYYAIPDHYQQWQQWVGTFAARPPWTFAHQYENIKEWRAFTRDPWNPTPRTPAPEVRRRGSEPMIVSEFGNWGLPDPTGLLECHNQREPWWFETGSDWGGGVAYPHGLEHRFREYHLDRVFGTLSGLAAASQRSQYVALKYQIEQIRQHPSLVGYIITEFTDLHWEANGLLDYCRNPKSFYHLLANINSADALVPAGWDRVVFIEGERFELHLVLSHFSSADLNGSRVKWDLSGWPEIHGEFDNLNPVPAQANRIGTIAFQVPSVPDSRRAQVNFQVYDAAGQLVTQNYHEIYLFPQRFCDPLAKVRLAVSNPSLARRLETAGYEISEVPEPGTIAVVKTLTDDIRLFAQNGGRVLWLAEAEDCQETYLGALGIKRRHGHVWQGDWASSFSWLRQDKMFENIPSAGVVDFAFADLTPEHVIDGLRPRHFAAEVYAGLFVGWLHANVALVVDRQIGNGRLLICTFRLSSHLGTNPVARLMMHDMIAHLANL